MGMNHFPVLKPDYPLGMPRYIYLMGNNDYGDPTLVELLENLDNFLGSTGI
jgi:hypothetical protein